MALLTRFLLSKPVVTVSRPLRRLLTAWPYAVTFRKRVAGHVLHVDLRTSIGRELLMTGSFDPAVFQPLAHHLRPGDTYLDIGANIGYYCLLALEKVGPSGHVHAFEIDPRPLQLLRRTIHNNRLSNLQLHPVSIGDHVGQATMVRMPDSGHTYLTSTSVGPSVPMTTLDALYAQGTIKDVRAIKIDVEGGEYSVLRGAQRFLTECKPLVVCEAQDKFLSRNSGNVRQLFEFFRECGYRWYWLAGAGSPTLVAEPK